MATGLSRLTLVGTLLALTACTSSSIDTSCAPAGKVTPICGVQMPEDLVALPDEGGLLIAEYGDMGHIPGFLTWYQPGPEARFVRLVNTSSIDSGSGPDNWGDAECKVPERLSPHGIHLSRRDEALQLLVVNHSAREHVLFYEVVLPPDGVQPPALAWRGCVEFPEEAVLNDVAALPDGGFAVTHMYQREGEAAAQLKSFLGLNKGHVWRWHPDRGAEIIPNSRARMPNGIEVDPSGKSIWVNNYIDGEVVQYKPDSGEILSTIKVPNLDNSAWLEDGRLLLASHHNPFGMSACFGLTEGSCGHGYDLVAVDTVSGDTEVIFSHPGGGPFGPATVAVPYRDKLYAGSFSGDRLGEITLN